MKYIIKIFFILLIFSTTSGAAFAQSTVTGTSFPRLDPDPKALDFFSLAEYSWTDLAQISLWASGDSSSARFEQIRTIAAAIRASSQFPASGRERAEFILDYMHKNILKTYSINQTGIDVLLSNGRFNCVSSAVLYMILCKSVGIDVSAVVTKDHSFAAVHINGESIDVETTNRYGFDPGNRREFHDQFGKLTGFAYVPARNYRDRRETSQIELISLIFWNRIADLEARNRFGDAVPLAIDRLYLLHGKAAAVNSDSYSALFEEPYESLVGRLLNYGAFLLRAGQEVDSLFWAAFASAKYPDEKRWPEFVYAAVNNRINRYLRANRTTDARNFLNSQRPVLSPESYAQFETLITDTDLVNRAARIRDVADGDAIVSSLEEARVNKVITERRATELLTFTVKKTASLFAAAPARDLRGAINYIEDIIARFGPNRELEQTLGMYQTNRATDFHNRFAAAWNRKNYSEAELILNEGLAEFPNDRRLLTDRETVNKNRR